MQDRKKGREERKKGRKRRKVREFKNLSFVEEKTLDKSKKIYYNSRPKTEERHQKQMMEEPMGLMFFKNLMVCKVIFINRI